MLRSEGTGEITETRTLDNQGEAFQRLLKGMQSRDLVRFKVWFIVCYVEWK